MFRSPLLIDCLAIALGGAFGALLRHGITRLAASFPGGSGPLGTTVANLLGCFAIGLLAGYVIAGGAISDRQQLAWRTGFLGSLTTFSTFAFEAVQFGVEQKWNAAILYTSANIVLGLIAAVLGLSAGRYIAQ